MWYEPDDLFDSIRLVETKSVKITPAIVRFLERSKKRLDVKNFEMDANPGPAPLVGKISEIDIFGGSPIKVKEDGDYYVILDGRHRFAAHLFYDFKNISVEVVE